MSESSGKPEGTVTVTNLRAELSGVRILAGAKD
jgi:hypothetical protein